MTSDAVLREPGATHGPATLTGQITSAELRSGDLLGGRFRIESLLGVGGMGVVYRARDLSLDIDVALKLLRPELARKPDAFERFRKELLLARQVSSPHVVRIHDIAEAGGRWFISMDFIDGESLEGYRDRVGKIPVEGALAVTHALLDGLSAAHARGVIHRDLKPANVLLDKTGHAYITDFGVARSLGATGLTQSGVIVGTPEYLSPEQARGDPADARSDLYTTGLILYEMLTGTLPFAGGTPAETVIQRIVRPPPSLAKARPDLPRWLHAFCERLLKVNPAHRLQSAKEALRALETKRVPRAPVNRRLV
ncbi:MAG: serine/threonine-protein kinase, partial [Rhodanobacteraceae bacterium]